MYKFSKKSKERKDTCHPELQVLLNAILNFWDCTVICGHRDKEAQTDAVRRRTSKTPWPRSKHNSFPSMAVDVAPYPVDYDDPLYREEVIHFMGYVMMLAKILKLLGLMTHDVRWGGDWDGDKDRSDQILDDLCHLELMRIEK